MSVTDNVPPPRPGIDLPTLRSRLEAMQGRAFWRGLEELAETPEFLEAARREFPRLEGALARVQGSGQDRTETAGLSRRAFLTALGASLALAGLSGCAVRQPQEAIVPYIDPPEGAEPGKPLFYATALNIGGCGQGVLVTSREGRPIKIDGNPTHPSSLGATDAITQAVLLSLYDPDRSQSVVYRGVPGTWDDFLDAMTTRLQTERATGGAGLRLLSGSILSPTLAEQRQELLAQYPNARWCVYEPVGRENTRAGAERAFGRDVQTVYHFDRADVIVALDGDFLLTLPGHVRYAYDFGRRRTVRKGQTDLNRLYAAESVPTITGAMADHRLPVRPAQMETIARALLAGVEAAGGAASAPALDPAAQAWVATALRDLPANRGRCVVVVGEMQTPEVHRLGHALNAALGNVGQTVTYTEPLEMGADGQNQPLAELAADMRSGRAQTLILLDCNPVYAAPADLDFASLFSHVPFSVHLGEYEDETAALCQWHLPQSHVLESWGDIRAHDGTITLQQPLLAPLYGTHTPYELLAVLNGRTPRSNHDILRDRWKRYHHEATARPTGAVSMPPGSRTAAPQRQLSNPDSGISTPGVNQSLERQPDAALNALPGGRNADPEAILDTTDDFDLFWRTILNDGVIPDTALPPLSVTLLPSDTGAGTAGSPPTPDSRALDLVFVPDPTLWDGRFANNGWLQELPKPLTKLTWDNAACIAPHVAQEQGLADGDLVTLRYRGRRVEAPILIQPGMPEGVVAISLGYGRTRAGSVGTGAGFNAYALRTSDAPWFGTGIELQKTGRKADLAVTHSHHTMESRDIVRAATITTFRRDSGFVHAHQNDPEKPDSLYADYHYPEYAWAMSIDLTRCIGCNACVAACQAENNIPVVGKEEVLRGREMHWLRVDRYYEGKNLDRPDATYFMPIPCMMCEHAPCELVCPPGATMHNRDGLNQMVYNRCIGTRYCSNNCPYKVRRFNFLQYADLSPRKQLMRNPEVTVRSRGVMEKCTYCVQRIENAKITADKENRLVRDGELTTACAQACPTNVIVFGNLADKNSQVAQLKSEPHDYGLLTELNTRPRTTYLGRVSNPAENAEG